MLFHRAHRYLEFLGLTPLVMDLPAWKNYRRGHNIYWCINSYIVSSQTGKMSRLCPTLHGWGVITGLTIQGVHVSSQRAEMSPLRPTLGREGGVITGLTIQGVHVFSVHIHICITQASSPPHVLYIYLGIYDIRILVYTVYIWTGTWVGGGGVRYFILSNIQYSSTNSVYNKFNYIFCMFTFVNFLYNVQDCVKGNLNYWNWLF